MKTKQNILSFLLFLMFLPIAIFAQDKQNRNDKVETMHIAYLSQKLDLSSEQAEKFWPLYNGYKADQLQLRKQRQNDILGVKQAGGIDKMSDAELQKLIASETDLETRELELRKQYVVKFQQAIPIKKVAKFFIVEDEFKRFLLNQLSRHRGEDHGGRGGDDNGQGRNSNCLL